MTGWEHIVAFREINLITDLEKEFVRFLYNLEENIPDEVALSAAACIHAQLNGHICLDLNQVSRTENWLFEDEKSGIKLTQDRLNSWQQALNDCRLVSKDGSLQPLVLENGRLYLHRYWKYEEELSDWLKEKSEITHPVKSTTKEIIEQFVKPSKDLFDVDWQEVALGLSFLKDLIVISGGPGTGKTHTVLNILAAHISVNDENYKVALAAPTGKAARRLMESIDSGNKALPKVISQKIHLPESAFTVHKLLGSNATGTHFKYNEENKLPHDLVVIDEASMLDITMWIRLIRALKNDAKLVVLGDKDQLASVEAGSILGDICWGENAFSEQVSANLQQLMNVPVPVFSSKDTSVGDCVVFLTKSYRFSENSGIHKLAQAINSSDADAVMEVLKNPKYNDVKWVKPSPEEAENLIQEYTVEHHKFYMEKDLEARLAASHNKKILCALRQSKEGSAQINYVAEKKMRNQLNLIPSKEWYPGRIVMATRNDNILKIRNGEIGIYQEEEKGIEFEGENKHIISTTRISDYEPAYAITIHKSQGSEFNEVVILLSNEDNPVLSKEILYTSVTRARLSTLIYAKEEIIRRTVTKSISRNSGLKEKIWSI